MWGWSGNFQEEFCKKMWHFQIIQLSGKKAVKKVEMNLCQVSDWAKLPRTRPACYDNFTSILSAL